MKANASNNYTLSKEEIEGIRRIIERGITIDKEEDKLYGDKIALQVLFKIKRSLSLSSPGLLP